MQGVVDVHTAISTVLSFFFLNKIPGREVGGLAGARNGADGQATGRTSGGQGFGWQGLSRFSLLT